MAFGITGQLAPFECSELAGFLNDLHDCNSSLVPVEKSCKLLTTCEKAKQLATAFAPYKFCVNTIAPGFVSQCQQYVSSFFAGHFGDC